MSVPDEVEFGRIRAFLWPIHRYEVRKIVPMLLMLFFICFNYTVLRNLKDVVVITAQSSGAEVLPFIKVWVLLPSAVLATIIFTKLSNIYSQERVFYLTISTFLIFFGLFAFVVYPNRDFFHPHEFADYLEKVMPAGFKGLIAMFRNWTFTIFYVFCELWSTMVLSVLFWGFANEITKISEARRFYGMLAVVGSFAGIVAGFGANVLSSGQHWQQALQTLIFAVVLFGGITMAIFYWMNKKVLNHPSFNDLHMIRKERKPKHRMSIRESVKYLADSKYLVCIAVITVCYNLVINLVEIVFKDQLLQLYPTSEDYSYFNNLMTSIVGMFATLVSLFMSTLVSRFGWTRTALITPTIMLITSAGFFGFMLFREQLAGPVEMFLGTRPLVIVVIFGALQVCLSKASKYSVFDSTREMAFIPLDHEVKLKGKAAIDGVGSRLGKSGGSLIHQGLLMVFATVGASAPYVAIILMAVIFGWMYAVRSLGHQFSALVGKEGREEMGEESKSSTATSA